MSADVFCRWVEGIGQPSGGYHAKLSINSLGVVMRSSPFSFYKKPRGAMY